MTGKTYDAKDVTIRVGGFRIDAEELQEIFPVQQEPINQKVLDFARSAVRGTSADEQALVERQRARVKECYARTIVRGNTFLALDEYENTFTVVNQSLTGRLTCSEPNIQRLTRPSVLVGRRASKSYEPARFGDLVGDLFSLKCMRWEHSWGMSWAEVCRLETIRAIRPAEPPETAPTLGRGNGRINYYVRALAACLKAMA